MEIYNGTYCVYVHINKTNGKMYVGKTAYEDNPNRRWRGGYGYKKFTYFRNAIDKYKWDNFDHEIVASHLTKSEADNFEKLLIKELHTRDCDFGYNLTDGGEGVTGYVMPECIKIKIGDAHKNRPLSDDHKKAISQAHIGKKYTEAQADRISNGHMNKRCKQYEDVSSIAQYDNKGTLLCVYPTISVASKETNVNADDIKRCLMGRASIINEFIWAFIENDSILDNQNKDKPKQIHYRAKSVCQYDKSGNLLKIWDSMSEASKILHISVNNIWKCCNNIEGRKSSGGFVWKYVVE